MLHPERTYQVVDVVSTAALPPAIQDLDAAEVLAEKLTGASWTLCTGFRLGDLLFLNDATSEDGAPEWAVFRLEPPTALSAIEGWAIQIETITFGWTTRAGALDYIERLQAGTLCTPMGRYTLKLDHPAGSCPHCA